MSQLSPIVTLTPKTPPHICGVGDYTINLATHCQSQLNLDINIVVETSCDPRSEPIKIQPLVKNWSPTGCQALLTELEASGVKTVILQYTGFSYSPKGFNLNLIPFWQDCAQRFQALLMVHETYNRWDLKYPGTWALNPCQKYLLRQLTQVSHQVFCGSETYLSQLKRIISDPQKLHYLPIPSNIPPDPLTSDQRQVLQHSLNLPSNHHVLSLFGCQHSIRQDWLYKLDRHLKQLNQPISWLLLGNAQQILLPLLNPVLRPGHLTASRLSHHLQLSDLLLMPHELGISAKRTSLMAAIEHGVPIIGTKGYLTDQFLCQLPSIKLVDDSNYKQFEQQVIAALAQLTTLKNAAKLSQAYYYKRLSWPIVTNTLLPYLKK